MIESTTVRYLMLLPDEERAKAVRALAGGDAWEWIPRHPNDEVEIEAVEFPRWSSAHQTWRVAWLVRGYAVRERRLVETMYCFDQDYRLSGRVEPVAECFVESDTFAAHTRRYAALAFQLDWARYFSWVAEQGEDPLGVLFHLRTRHARRQRARLEARRRRAAWEDWRAKVGESARRA